MSNQKPGNKRRTVVVVGILATALTLGIAGTVVAKQSGYGCEGGQRQMGFGAKAIDELGLSAEDKAKLESLRSQAMEMRKESRDAMSEVREAFRAQRDADNPNLRAVVEQAQKIMDERRAQRQAMMDEGLAFYETLSPEQQRKVMGMLENRFGRHAQGGQHRGHGAHHRGHGRGYEGSDNESEG